MHGYDYHPLLTQENLVSSQSTYPRDARHADFTSLSAITKNWCWTTSMYDGKLKPRACRMESAGYMMRGSDK